MTNLTDSQTVWAEWTQSILSDATWNNSLSTPFKDVFYGDQEKIPATPVICVDPSAKRRTFNGAPRKTAVDFEAMVLIYHGRLQDVQQTRKDVDALAEAVESRLHQFPTCGGLVISSLVSQLESGVAVKSGALMRATRLTWTATSQIMLPLYDPNNP